MQVLDENDNVPTFLSPSFEFSVEEEAPIGTWVGTLVARDADEGVNAQLTFSLDAPTARHAFNSPISQHAYTGKSSVTSNLRPSNVLQMFSIHPLNETAARIVTMLPLDRELAAEYTFVVTVKDSGNSSGMGPLSSNATVRVLILGMPVRVLILGMQCARKYSKASV